MNTQRTFRTVARLEGLSFLALLFVAMPIKYLLHYALAVRLVGGLHGVLFFGFLTQLFRVVLEEKWAWRFMARVFLLNLLPFGFIAIERHMVRISREAK
jgi:integral membrane protein